MERTLYNGLISGVSLDGKTFFYPNPLESNGQHAAQPLVRRRLLSRQHHALHAPRCPATSTRSAATRSTSTSSSAAPPRSSSTTAAPSQLTQETRYPWDGAVKMTVDPDQPAALTINVRIPGWARNEPVAERPLPLRRNVHRARHAQGQRQARADPARQGLRRARAHLEDRRRHRARICRCPYAASLANSEVAADRGRVALAARPHRLRRRVGRQSRTATCAT